LKALSHVPASAEDANILGGIINVLRRWRKERHDAESELLEKETQLQSAGKCRETKISKGYGVTVNFSRLPDLVIKMINVYEVYDYVRGE